MNENLRYNVPGGSWDYNGDESYTMGAEGKPPYGKLYSWEAVEEAVPPGWHLPTDQEWKRLESELGMIAQAWFARVYLREPTSCTFCSFMLML